LLVRTARLYSVRCRFRVGSCCILFRFREHFVSVLGGVPPRCASHPLLRSNGDLSFGSYSFFVVCCSGCLRPNGTPASSMSQSSLHTCHRMLGHCSSMLFGSPVVFRSPYPSIRGTPAMGFIHIFAPLLQSLLRGGSSCYHSSRCGSSSLFVSEHAAPSASAPE
jgi:hypothetical protein